MPLVSVFFAVAIVAVGGLVAITGAVVERIQVQTAADAAALAAVADGRKAGERVAAANGTTLIEMDVVDDGLAGRVGRVRVVGARVEAVATAERYAESNTTGP